MRPGDVDASAVTIEQYEITDYDAVKALWDGGGRWLCDRPSDRRDQIALKLERDPDLFLVARAEGRVVGCVIGGWDGRRAYVYHLAVEGRWRRRGVASALLDELERRFRAKGALKAKCQVFVQNEGSLAFFRSRGYDIEPELFPLGKELA